MNLYDVNDEEMYVWANDLGEAKDIAVELGFDVNSIKKLHEDDFILVTSENKDTGEIEWMVDDGNPRNRPLRTTTVKKLAIELNLDQKR